MARIVQITSKMGGERTENEMDIKREGGGRESEKRGSICDA